MQMKPLVNCAPYLIIMQIIVQSIFKAHLFLLLFSFYVLLPSSIHSSGFYFRNCFRYWLFRSFRWILEISTAGPFRMRLRNSACYCGRWFFALYRRFVFSATASLTRYSYSECGIISRGRRKSAKPKSGRVHRLSRLPYSLLTFVWTQREPLHFSYGWWMLIFHPFEIEQTLSDPGNWDWDWHPLF